MLTLKELKEKHDKAYEAGQVTRERAANDMVFYYVTQWDTSLLAASQLAYRGEFDLLKKAGRKIVADLAMNSVQIDFEPVEGTRKDSAELVDGVYRAGDTHNTSIEAYEMAKNEAVVCGVGAWELYTEYKDMRGSNDKQTIKRRPLWEANNNVFWDANAKRIDKSDATYVSVLTAYSEDGYLDLVEELTGKRPDEVDTDSFSQPEQSYSFPWLSGEGKKIYVVKFYHRTKEKDNILTLVDPFQREKTVYESELDQVMDDMIDQGYTITVEKEITRYRVRMYIASGSKILSNELIAGTHIPVIPMYGEYAYVEGEVHYEGVTRLAKDPQRLRNFQGSYLADITSRGPTAKPIFFKEQIAGHEYMYETAGIDNRFNYLLQNRTSITGEDLPIGPVSMMPDQGIPEALIASIAFSREAIEDVATPGTPQSITDPETSGKAVYAVQAQIELQTVIYQSHYKHAKRRDAEVYADMLSTILDVPSEEQIELSDGTRDVMQVMQSIIDEETGEPIVIHDLTNSYFNVTSRIGPDYGSQKEQTIDRIEKMIMLMAPNDPIRQALQLKQLALMDGIDFGDIRDYARKQLIITGIKKPDTDEEKKMLEEASKQKQQPDAAMVLAKAEELKGQADIMQEKREGIKMQMDDARTKDKHYIDVFKATTERMRVQVEAKKAGATINKVNMESIGEQVDTHAKILEMIKPERPEKQYANA